jgi:hypothetical protein
VCPVFAWLPTPPTVRATVDDQPGSDDDSAVVDVVGLYHNPPDRAVVLCVDEKSGIQALDRSSPVLPMMPGMPERRTHDYVWHGTTSQAGAAEDAPTPAAARPHAAMTLSSRVEDR